MHSWLASGEKMTNVGMFDGRCLRFDFGKHD
jgi:hypothetical protein